MANIPSVNPFNAPGAVAVAPVALAASNTLTYNGATRQVLFIRNASAAAVDATLVGSDASENYRVPGTGAELDLSTGQKFTLQPGTLWSVPLSNFREYLRGDVALTVSAFADVTAWIVEV